MKIKTQIIFNNQVVCKSIEEISDAVDKGADIENFFYTIKEMISENKRWIIEIK